MALQTLTEENFDSVIKGAHLAMVDVWATWCGPCKMLGPVIDKLADAYDGKVVVGKVDADEEMELAQKCGIASIPTVIFFKDGVEFDRRVGVVPEGELREVLDANL